MLHRDDRLDEILPGRNHANLLLIVTQVRTNTLTIGINILGNRHTRQYYNDDEWTELYQTEAEIKVSPRSKPARAYGAPDARPGPQAGHTIKYKKQHMTILSL